MLDNVNIDRSKDYSDNNKAALTVKGNGDTEIELDGDNILKGGYKHAGLEKNDSDGTGTLTIKDDNKAADGSKGSLLAKGGYDGAGIGGGEYQDTSNITVTGGKVTAVSGNYAAGIGGGYQSDGTDITIKGDATVIASGDTGAGIGGGGDGKGYGKVTITDHANVTAWSEFGAGIGGGRHANGDIIISGDATVAAEAYNDSIAIGSGGRSYSLLDTNITIRDRANVTAVGSGWHPAIGSRGYVGYPGSVVHPYTTTINILGGTLNVINRGDNHYTSNVPAIGNESSNYSTATKADLVLNLNASTGDTVINAYTTGSNAATIGIGNHDALMKDDEQIQYNADGSSKFGKAGSVVLKPDIIEHFGNADAVPQPPERCLSRKAGIVRCCLRITTLVGAHIVRLPPYHLLLLRASRSPSHKLPPLKSPHIPSKSPRFILQYAPKCRYSILSQSFTAS